MSASSDESPNRSLTEDGAREAAHHMAGVKAHGLKEHIKRERERAKPDEYSSNPVIRAGQQANGIVDTLIVIVIAVVVGYVGVKAASETDDSIDVANNSSFDNASDSLTDGFTSAMDLTEVVFIVLMLGLIIGALLGLRSRRRR